MPDGLIFEYEVDRKGVSITCTQRELVKCRHCKYAQLTPVLTGKDDNMFNYPLQCRLVNAYVDFNHYCASGLRED